MIVENPTCVFSVYFDIMLRMLHPYNPDWIDKYTQEEKVIKQILGTVALDIQHIGSTAIPGIMAKPIIDIAVLIHSLDEAEKLIPQIEKEGYVYEKDKSSVERFYFTKGNPEEYHLSLAQPHKHSYWRRQILFRDYLRSHSEYAKAYEELKLKAIESDVANYLRKKGPFIEEILKLAEISTNFIG